MCCPRRRGPRAGGLLILQCWYDLNEASRASLKVKIGSRLSIYGLSSGAQHEIRGGKPWTVALALMLAVVAHLGAYCPHVLTRRVLALLKGRP